jgi:cell division protein FtsZ
LERTPYQRKRNDQKPLRNYVFSNNSPGGVPIRRKQKKPLGKTNCYVVGVGGGGNNAVNRLKSTAMKNAYCICINTDLQHLQSVNSDATLLIGEKTTRGLGCGGKPSLGKAAAEESHKEIERLLSDADVVFLTVCLGGGTGTGAVPIIAEIAKKNGAIVIGMVTIPFTNEGARKQRAYDGLENLRQHADTVVIIENDQLLQIAPDLPLEEAFSVADEVLANYIYSIITTVTQAGLINVDFADLKSIITQGGVTICGVGEASGDDRAVKAVEKALEHPLIQVNYSYSQGALIYVSGGSTMSLKEASGVVEEIKKRLHTNAEVIWGAKVDQELADVIRVTVIISGVKSNQIIGNQQRPSDWYSLKNRRIAIGRSNLSRDQPISRAKENWLRRETVPVFKEIRERVKKNKKKQSHRSENKKEQKQEPDEFWDELGLSKGLK